MNTSLSPEAKERREQLIHRLRTGGYVQGKGSLLAELYGEKRYCCLGVASQQFIEEVENSGCAWNKSKRAEGIIEFINENNSYASYLPETVRDYFGFEGDNPKIHIKDELELRKLWDIVKHTITTHDSFHSFCDGYANGIFSLADLNDQGVSFAAIADVLEQFDVR